MMKSLISGRGLLVVALLLLLLIGLAPIPGQVLWVPDSWRDTGTWPQIHLEPEFPQPGQSVRVAIADVTPWTNVLLIAGEVPVKFERYEQSTAAGYWRWYWSLTLPKEPGLPLRFYHDCDTGCLEWAATTVGAVGLPATSPPRLSTKLGIVFAYPRRDWHNRSGWDVELTYALKAEAAYWGIDDLAQRVQKTTATGLKVLIRVDYAPDQSLPPANDYLALNVYLNYVRRLARDARLKRVYGYLVGSGYNTKAGNSQAPEAPVTPEWYARVFNGYNADPTHTDNVLETIHAENPGVRVLVGPVRPWVDDQNGQRRYQIDVPWLNYLNTMLAAIDASAAANTSAGIPLAAPDGVAVQAPGRPDAPDLASHPAADEPGLDLRRPEWNNAQAGFRVYRDWLDVINAYPRLRGLPVYITSTNTYSPDGNVPPAQNYPQGWLTAALAVVNQEPQIQSLCWFLDDFPMDNQWQLFSLTNPQGLLINAADEFDRLLSDQP